MNRVLYVCPLAHYVGHYPFVVGKEPKALTEAGLDITLLTFTKSTDEAAITVPRQTTLPNNQLTRPVASLLRYVRRLTLLRWAIVTTEIVLTQLKAVWLLRSGKYDVAYLRDGEPFYFLPFLFSIPFKNLKWVISSTATNLFIPKSQSPILRLYNFCLSLINCPLWRPIYQLAMRRNSFTFAVQNENAKENMENYLEGVFKGKVHCISLGTDRIEVIPQKNIARQTLGLPQDKFILLSFGAPHAGKNLDTVFKAVEKLDNVLLVHAGKQAFNLNKDAKSIASTYNLDGKVKIFDYYIPEAEKPLFFAAADVAILSYTKAFASTASLLWETAKYRLPVISSNANSLGDMVSRHKLGVLFEAEDSQSLVTAVDGFRLLPKAMIGKLKNNCDKFCQEYGIETWANKTKELLCSSI